MYNPFYEFVGLSDDCYTNRLKYVAVNAMNTMFDIHSVVLLRPCNQHRPYKVPYMNTSSICIYLFIYLSQKL
jgi:hypothetical protein